MERDRDQLWAEAVAREASGVSIRLPEELWLAAADEQHQREVENPFLEVLDQTLRTHDDTPMQGKIWSEDVWKILQLLRPSQRTQQLIELRNKAMKEFGWQHSRLRNQGTPSYCYVKGTEPYRLIEVEVVDSGTPGTPPLVEARYADQKRTF